MKKTLSILSLGAGMVVAFTACQQTGQNDYPGGYEEALPMSEMAIADGELPPWLLEDNEDGEQIPAGDYTDHSFPDDEIKVAEVPSGGAASQNQPHLAQDDTIVDSDTRPLTTAEGATIIPTPIPGGATESPVTEGTVATITKPAKPKPAAKPGRSTADIKKLTAKEKKSIKKPKEPTVVTYKVRPGDNLTLIAKRSNTTVAQIRKDSGIKGDLIYPGQIIKVKYYPKGSKAAMAEKKAKASSYTVKRGDSVSDIAARHGVSTAALLKANNLTMKQASKIQPGRKLTIPAGSGSAAASNSSAKSTIHTVKRGESVARIASRYGVTTEEILKANKLTAKQAAKIQPGRKLTIPAKKSNKRNRR
ncbi:MAG: LysM peptidoglycan-binding domain-containing protein [Akkermansia sp.]|nr:LysM peptidoglycan-binding domain-containing protein [Akkermansia sp.]